MLDFILPIIAIVIGGILAGSFSAVSHREGESITSLVFLTTLALVAFNILVWPFVKPSLDAILYPFSLLILFPLLATIPLIILHVRRKETYKAVIATLLALALLSTLACTITIYNNYRATLNQPINIQLLPPPPNIVLSNATIAEDPHYAFDIVIPNFKVYYREYLHRMLYILGDRSKNESVVSLPFVVPNSTILAVVDSLHSLLSWDQAIHIPLLPEKPAEVTISQRYVVMNASNLTIEGLPIVPPFNGSKDVLLYPMNITRRGIVKFAMENRGVGNVTVYAFVATRDFACAQGISPRDGTELFIGVGSYYLGIYTSKNITVRPMAQNGSVLLVFSP